MSYIIVPRRHQFQPLPRTEIDWRHELLYTASDVFCPAHDALERYGSHSISPTTGGLMSYGGSTNYAIKRGRIPRFHNHGGSYTVTFVAMSPLGTTEAAAVGFSMAGTSYRGAFNIYLHTRTDGNSQAGGFRTSFSPASGTTYVPPITLGFFYVPDPVAADLPFIVPFRVSAVSVSTNPAVSSDITMWINGKKRTDGHRNGGSYPAYTQQDYSSFGSGTIGYNCYPQFQSSQAENIIERPGFSYFGLVILHRSKVPEEIQRELTLNPWQVFKSHKQVLYFGAGGGPGPSGTTRRRILLAA